MNDSDQTLDLVTAEIHEALKGVAREQIDELISAFESTGVWFCGGQGRSGLVARMIAMRLMHLGRTSHVIGGTTTPAIARGNGTLIISASGRTPTSLTHARAAHDQQATVAVVTSCANSPLAAVADVTVVVPTTSSRQFGGSLFEQTSLVLLDAVMLRLESNDANARAAMHARHANLE